MATRVGAVVLLCVGVALAVPADLSAEEAVNQAIDSQMQLQAMGGDAEATQAFSDLNPYLGKDKKKMDPWESQTVASIRGMSEANLAISTVSQDELRFARDAEEAKDVIDQTKQMAAIRQSQDKDQAASAIAQQLAQAKASLTAAADTNQRLGETHDDMDTTEFLQYEFADRSLDGPMDGGVFFGEETYDQFQKNHVESDIDESSNGVFIEVEENSDYDSALLSGSDADVEAEIDAAITSQVTNRLEDADRKVKQTSDKELDAFAKDTEAAQAAVEDMKATIVQPTEDTKLDTQDVKVAQKQATQEASDDAQLGDAQEEHKNAQTKLSASEEITAELAAAQDSLNSATGIN